MTLRERIDRLIKECTDVAYDHLAIRCDFAEKIEALILEEVNLDRKKRGDEK